MAAEEVKEIINETPAKTDFAALLEGVDLNKLLEFDSVKKLVQAQSDKRVTQALATAKSKWEQEQAQAQTEAEKLKRMTAEQQEKYRLDQEKAAFEKERAAFQHAQLVVETQKQLLAAGLPDLAEYITGTTAEETTANIAKISDALGAWKSSQLTAAMRGTVPHDTNPQDSGEKLTAADIKKMTTAEINAAWNAGKIDTASF